MSEKNSAAYDKVLEPIMALIEKSFSGKEAALIMEFARQYYIFTPVDDLLQRDARDLFGAMISHWKQVAVRKAGESKVRVYNPHYEQHGWQSTHTVIEVAHEDMPFLVDTLRMEINRMGISIHLIIHMGGMLLRRDDKHVVKDILPLHTPCADCEREAPILIEIDRQTDPDRLRELEENLQRVLGDVRLAVKDWPLMQQCLQAAIKELDHAEDKADPAQLEESRDFLKWMGNNHFTFLGYQEYEFSGKGKTRKLSPIVNSALGILRCEQEEKGMCSLSALPEEALQLAESSDILSISKSNAIATVHRPTYMDYIGVKRFDKHGELIGERRFIGLYTSVAYNSSPRQIPFLRLKVSMVLERSKLTPGSHSAKDLLNILDSLPRDDLFQATSEELLEIATGILHIQERRRIRLFVREDRYKRFMSCLVYVPREHFNTELRKTIESILMEAFNGVEASFTTYFGESVLARIHFLILLNPEKVVSYDLKALENQIIEAGRTWSQDLQLSLIEYFGEEKGSRLYNKYASAFPAGYRETFPARTATFDIEHIESLVDEQSLGMSFYNPLEEFGKSLRFKLYHQKATVPLSDVLPLFEKMGLRVIGEQPYRLRLSEDFSVWINDFNLVRMDADEADIEDLKELFQEAFSRVWRGDAENDGFNRLILSSKLNWREVMLIRAYAKYLRQAGITFSQEYIENTFYQNPVIVSLLIHYFNLRFNPAGKLATAAALQKAETAIIEALEQVTNLDEDRILRRYLDLINATLRTNFFQTDAQGQIKSYVSFKFDPSLIPELPLPLPKYEIFVYSPRFEGVHLRSAKVARGGLRWSDRREDFRTEVLGLMKAQAVKNAVIVPNGAKGGFVAKCLPVNGSREAVLEEGIYCYKHFISGLLDITDNLCNDEVAPPKEVVRYDEDDPYLVVAADKGTATFSDIANGVSREYNFWLKDAFASGGSVGYDHKKMGITAKGAWESVKRHFLELGFDTQTTDFTVIGIGDMAGDVFGNGMLLSKHIRLLGAFNHLHIFIDPNPDAASSWEERKRLFDLPRSSWEDYNADLISKGGGIFRRNVKSIKLTPEIKALFNLKQDVIVPNELIKVMLKAKVDLLWNGGIGTYVKAESETHLDVGDRTNDALRVNGNELQCKVVGEGGNLGFTQLGRVEYALNGGVLNTDFIDNSAGVDCSDHEVNIKILLNRVVDNGDLTEKQRNQLLEQMEPAVGQMVLRHNYYQTLAVSLGVSQSVENLDLYRRFIHVLEKEANLNRALEFLPTDKEIARRQTDGQGLVRPEVAVLLAYSKMTIKAAILKSDLPENPFVARCIHSAFPELMREKFGTELLHHRLHRELIATRVSNDLVDEMGISFVQRLREETGASVALIARAYNVAKDIHNTTQFWRQIEALDKKVKTSIQLEMMLRLSRLLRRCTRWLLRNQEYIDAPESTIEYFKPAVQKLAKALPTLLVGIEYDIYEKHQQHFVDAGVPAEMATQVASTNALYSSFDIIGTGRKHNMDIIQMAEMFYHLGQRLEADWLRHRIINHPVANNWESLSRALLRDDLTWEQIELVVNVLKFHSHANSTEERIQQWVEFNREFVERWEQVLNDFRSSANISFTMFFVAVRELLGVVQSSRRLNYSRLIEARTRKNSTS